MPYKDPERRLAYFRQRYQDNKGYWAQWRPSQKKKDPETYRANKRAYYAAHPEQQRRHDKRYRINHPEVVFAHDAARRASKAQASINDLTAAQWEEIKEAFDYRCVYCPPDCKACKRKTHKLTQEHLTPLHHHGDHTVSNVVPACQSCNSKRRTGPVLTPVQPLLLTIAPARPIRSRKKRVIEQTP